MKRSSFRLAVLASCSVCLVATAQTPQISTISPISAPVGTAITITGSNFGATPAANLVYIGAVKAPVTAASSTALTAIVPTGTSYQPVTVTTNGYTAYAAQSVSTSFAANTGDFTPNSFAAKADYATGYGTIRTYTGDMDGDGKADLVTMSWNSSAVNVYRNNSTVGTLAFVNNGNLTVPSLVSGVAIGDIDADGKLDVVVTAATTGTVSVFRNTSTAGSISFAARTDVTTLTNPSNVVIGDMDGDGKPDLAVPLQGYSIVSLLRNTSVGTSISFAPRKDISINSVNVIALGDVDGDGKTDMVVPNYYSATLSVYRNTSTPGDMLFAPQTTYAVGSNPSSAAFGDLDGDGKPEVMVTNFGSASTSVLRNQSSSGIVAFAAKADVACGVNPNVVSVSDFNGDGKLDLVTANGAFTFSVLRNTGSGSIAFSPTVDYYTGGTADGVTASDMDGDGKPDVLVGNVTPGSVSIFRNQTDGPDVYGFSPANASSGTAITITGINFTGVTAVRIGGIAASSFTVNSPATITATVAAFAGGPITVTTPKGMAAKTGFYNGPAITSVSPSAGAVGAPITISGSNFNVSASSNTVYFGAVKATPTTATNSTLTVALPSGATYQPVTVTANTLTAYAGQPFGVTPPFSSAGVTSNAFAAKQDLPMAANSNPNFVGSGDFDGDGKADLVTSQSNNAVISIHRNTSTAGAVSFAPETLFNAGYLLTSAAVADFDRDGKSDLVVVGSNGTSVYVYRNTSTTGTISFAAYTSLSTGTGNTPRSVVAGDFDGDGKPDIAVISGKLHLFKNASTVGLLAFEERVDYPSAGGSPVSMAIGDIDGDGRPDLAITNYTFYLNVLTASVFKNSSSVGAISFNSKTDYITNNGPSGVSLGDLDGDSKPDMVITNKASNNVSVFRNTSSVGAVSFAEKVDVVTGNAPTSIAIADLDGDAKPEITLTNSGANTVSILKNNSTAGILAFNTKMDFATGATPQGVSIGDLNDDGKPDLTIANAGANFLSVLRNQVDAPIITAFLPANAAIGATLTITGSSFTGATAVSIGGVPATSFTVLSNVEIAAVVAAASGGDVTVTTANGTAALSGFYNGPVITSVSPLSGSIGATVTISGNNFNPIPANNTVYFGVVKAAVTSGNSSSLTVKVPVGATHQPITVTTSNLTAYAAKPFGVTFSTNTSSFTPGSFASKVDFASGTNPYALCLGDLDGDGKADMIAGSGANALSVFKNTGSSGAVAFAGKIDITTPGPAVDVTAADINGDGKLDLIATNASANVVSVFRNTSSGGAISFAARLDYTTGNLARSIAVADFNNDGKPDLVVTNGSSNTISVFRNTGVGGAVSFATKVDFTTASSPSDVAIADVDGDGKPDIVVSNSSDYSVSVFRNTSNSNLSFATKVDFTTAGYVIGFAVGDLDGDGKPDIAAANYNSNILSVLRNQSVAGALSFAPKVDYGGFADPRGVAITDLDGDGKPELAVTNRNSATVSVLKNASNVGALSFAAKADYAVDSNPYSVTIGDLDGDGKPDIAVANYGANNVSVLKNSISSAGLCVGGSTSFSSNSTGAVYQWQVDAGSGFINLSDGANYSGTTTASLQLTNLSFAWSGYQYRCVVDGVAGNVFLLELKNYWTGAVSNAWEEAANWSCNVVPDVNTDVVITSGAVTVNSMAVCRSLKASTGTTVTVSTGFNLFIAK